MQAFGVALKKNMHMAQTLTVLNLNGNKLESDGTNSLAAFLAQPNTLERILLRDTAVSVDILLGALNRGSCRDLKEIDMSHNKIAKTSAAQLVTFIKASSGLVRLNLSASALPSESFREVIMAIYSNPYIKSVDLNVSKNALGLLGAKAIMSVASEMNNIEKLDLSENEMDDESILMLTEGLCHAPTLKKLNISRNLLAKGSRQRRDAIEGLNNLLMSECPIESLVFQGNRTPVLAADLLAFIDALGSNTKLLHLDITGQNLGNKGASALGKALQTNRTLQSLSWDENGTQIQGFKNFRAGLKRNPTLKNMPMPLVDVDGCMAKEPERSQVLKVVRDIEQLILSNNAPRAKRNLGADAGFKEFLFYVRSIFK
jgi:Ran GTPase-activating protein (RanGAP) involved in mRNA processing and transport